MKLTFGSVIGVVVSALLLQEAGAVVRGQVDTFQNGTTQGWANGGGAPQPIVISNGGPAGAGDAYLQATSDGIGAGGRLTVFNRVQWPGDYIGQSVNAISIDLRNFGQVTLSIRIAFKSSTDNSAPGYVSAQPFTLLPGTGWQTALFQINPSSMTAVNNPAPFSTFFSSGNVEMRIINAVNGGDLNGDFVTAQLGIDNIRAVPEPTANTLIISALLALTFARFGARLRTPKDYRRN